MKKLSILLIFVLAGCASNDHYSTYVDAQKSLSRDATVAEAARIAALTEMVKSSDNEVRIQAIKALQEIQRSKRPITLKPTQKHTARPTAKSLRTICPQQ
jgi:hypothetical protein